MGSRIQRYVWLVVAATVASTGLMYVSSPNVAPSAVTDALLLCALAITAELLGFLLPRAATGSIGFIPYFASAIVIPQWPSVVAVILVKAAVEIWSRRPLIKAALNISAHALGEVMAVTVFVALGGVSLRAIPNLTDLAHVTQVAAVPALMAFLVGSVANNLIVTKAIALSTDRSVSEVLRANRSRVRFWLDFMAWPLIFVFAWIYAKFGAMAAAAFWVPILGFRQVHRTNLELEQTNEELLELMVKSIEARDPYTSGHSRRVQQFSIIIARALGLRDREVEQIGRAALLHDVGKIYEKYAGVLSKQDKLTSEEWAIIQEHPVDGANLVATMTRLRDLVPAIRHHHENWDGTGYPDRIAGDAIPLGARIIRFADTIDAMTTERPYRRPLSEAQVRAEVIRCRGTQFDPEIADRLLASPLWPTMFAPASNDRSIAPLSVLSAVKLRVEQRPARAAAAARLRRG